jgi:hypothetical protein
MGFLDAGRLSNMSWSEITRFPASLPVEVPILDDRPPRTNVALDTTPQWHAGGGGSREVLNDYRDGTAFDQDASAALAARWQLDHPPWTQYLPYIGGGLILLFVLMK